MEKSIPETSFDIPFEAFEKLTSLNQALELFDKEKWFLFKKELLGAVQFDKEREEKIYNDFRYLMEKAIEHSFEKVDYDKLESYRRLITEEKSESLTFLETITGKRIIPTQVTLYDEDGKIAEMDFSSLDMEITAALFDQIWEVLTSRMEIRSCDADGCESLFNPKRKTRKYCTRQCQQRQFKRNKANNPSSHK